MTAITSVSTSRRQQARPAGSLADPRRPLPRVMLWRPSRNAVILAATLLGIFALGWFSALTRPAETVAAVWWPA